MTSRSQPRRCDIDALRVGAVLVGWLYHSGRAFDTEAWHIKDAVASGWSTWVGVVLTPWRMPLLMLLAAAGTYFAWDAAHPMYPVGSNGASQAILDARALTDHLTSGTSVDDALAAYDLERRPASAAIVLTNREGGPERVIDAVEARAPNGFEDIGGVLGYAEREAIVRGYANLAGYSVHHVNRPSGSGGFSMDTN